MIVLDEDHLLRLLREYVTYYHDDRTHLGLGKDTPVQRDIESPDKGATILALPRVGGLHHRYTRKAALGAHRAIDVASRTQVDTQTPCGDARCATPHSVRRLAPCSEHVHSRVSGRRQVGRDACGEITFRSRSTFCKGQVSDAEMKSLNIVRDSLHGE